MARITNDPAKYVTRTKNLPSFDADAKSCPKRFAERERSFLEAPISEGYYIDHRKPQDGHAVKAGGSKSVKSN